MRRLAITFLVAPFAGLVGLTLLGTTANADDTVPPETTVVITGAAGADSTDVATDLAPVDVLQVSGLFDGVTVKSIENAIDDSEAAGSQAIILQLNTGGAVVSDAEMKGLLEKIANAKVAVAIWVGQSRDARAYGTPAQLFGVADVTAMVAGSRIGYTGDLIQLDGDVQVALGAGADRLRNGSMSFSDARSLNVLRLTTSDEGVPTVKSMVLAMDGAVVDVAGVETELDTITARLNDDGNEENVATLVRFSGLGLVDELFHTVGSPPIAFLFFVIGCCLLIFEFFTAGVGVAGFVGAVLTIFGCYGFSTMPTRPGALVLLVLALLAFAIDVQVGIPRLWTGVGTTLFVLSAFFLYEPLPGNNLRLGWITLFFVISGVLLTFIVGMPSMVRTRFATPTIGREWMIGSSGVAVGAISPEGIAQVGAAKWRARTNRATPLEAGAELRVVAIDGVTLEVEPIEGAARDYRERRPKGEAADEADSSESSAASDDASDTATA